MHNHCSHGKAICSKYYECVCILISFLCCIILLSVSCLALPYFPTLSHKQDFFSEKVIEHIMWVLIFSFLILRRIL